MLDNNSLVVVRRKILVNSFMGVVNSKSQLIMVKVQRSLVGNLGYDGLMRACLGCGERHLLVLIVVTIDEKTSSSSNNYG